MFCSFNNKNLIRKSQQFFPRILPHASNIPRVAIFLNRYCSLRNRRISPLISIIAYNHSKCFIISVKDLITSERAKLKVLCGSTWKSFSKKRNPVRLNPTCATIPMQIRFSQFSLHEIWFKFVMNPNIDFISFLPFRRSCRTSSSSSIHEIIYINL